MLSIIDCGAVADGKTVVTSAFQKAIDHLASKGGGTVYIPAGTYVCGTVHLSDNVHIVFEDGARLLGSRRMEDFAPYEEDAANTVYQDRSHSYFHHSLFHADGCQNISFSGHGVIDMQSEWELSPSWCRAIKMFALKNCAGVVIEDLILRNGTDLAVYFAGCENVRIAHLDIKSHIDGISPDSCKNVVITDCILDVGDDAIVPKSSFTLGRFQAMENLVIANCLISSRCSAIKFGTESNTGFLNITVTGCTIYNTRFSGIALEAIDGAVIDGVSISNITMRNVGNPFMLLVMNRARGPEGTGIGSIQNVTISNLTATGPYEAWNAMALNYDTFIKADTVQSPVPVPAIIAGQPDSIIKNVALSNLQCSMPGGGTLEDRAIVVPNVREGYPESVRFGRKMPIYGLFARCVDNLKLYNVDFYTETPDARDAMLLEHVTRYKEV